VEVTVAVEYGEWTVVASKEGPLGASATLTFDPVEARYVRLTLRDEETWFHLCEVEVYGSSKLLFMQIKYICQEKVLTLVHYIYIRTVKMSLLISYFMFQQKN
jgi:hypothetical protein